MNRHLRLAPAFLVLFLAATTFSDAQDKKDKAGKTPTVDYYPLEVGNTWNFKVEVGGNNANAISKITKTETFNGVQMSRLEASVNGKVVANEHLRQTAEGVFRHRNNGQEIEPPVCLIKYPVKAGSKWQGDIKVGAEDGKYFCESAEETVEVPAGKFKAIRVDINLEAKGQKIKTSYWFVKDMGFVKQTVDAAGLNIVMSLEKFERAKATIKKDK